MRHVGRVLAYVLGLFFIALGVAFSVNSDLGVSPVNSLPYVLGQVLGVPTGWCVVGVFSCYLFLQFLLLGRRFRLVQLSQLLCASLFGYFVDFAAWLLGDFCFPGYPGRLAMLALSMPIMALGLVLYLQMDLIPMPMEGLALALTQRVPRLPFHSAKTILDCCTVGTAVLLSLLCFHRLVGVREGTVVSALLLGRLIPLIRRPLAPLLDHLRSLGRQKAAPQI